MIADEIRALARRGLALFYPSSAAELLAIADRVEAVERDAARLDWLERDDGEFYNIDRITAVVGIGFNRQPNLRNAIDAARKEQADADR